MIVERICVEEIDTRYDIIRLEVCNMKDVTENIVEFLLANDEINVGMEDLSLWKNSEILDTSSEQIHENYQGMVRPMHECECWWILREESGDFVKAINGTDAASAMSKELYNRLLNR